MPLADTLHVLGFPHRNLILKLPFGEHIEFMSHAAWVVTYPVLFVELCCLLRFTVGLRWPAALGLSALMPLYARVVIEPVPIWIMVLMGRRGIHWNPWAITTALCLFGLCLWLTLWFWLSGRRRWPLWSLGSAMCVAGLVAVIW
jgi:hypothetical protein